MYAVFEQPKKQSLVPSDPDSRYKVRQLHCQILGKGKMRKTVLRNVHDVAKDMHCSAEHLVMFLVYELNVAGFLDYQKQAAIGGAHEAADLSVLIQKFIETFLLCQVCGLPELVHQVKHETVQAHCSSCGNHGRLVLNEKFERYLVRHPPAADTLK